METIAAPSTRKDVFGAHAWVHNVQPQDSHTVLSLSLCLSISSDAYLSIHLYVYVNIYTYNQHITDSIYIYIYMSAINIYVSKVTVPDLVVWVRESGHSAAAERQV